MSDQIEGARTLPVRFKDAAGDGTVREILEVRHTPTPLGDFHVTSTDAPAFLSDLTDIPEGATYVEIMSSDDIRATTDGVLVPSDSVGRTLFASTLYRISGDLTKLRVYGASDLDGGFYT